MLIDTPYQNVFAFGINDFNKCRFNLFWYVDFQIFSRFVMMLFRYIYEGASFACLCGCVFKAVVGYANVMCRVYAFAKLCFSYCYYIKFVV